MKIKIFSLLIIIFASLFIFEINNVFAGSPAVQNFRETAIKGFADSDLSGEASVMITEAALSDTGVVLNLSSGIGKIIGAGLSFLGVLFLILMIYGGFIWMFARGNEQAVVKAKELIQAAVIGLVIILSAYALTSYLGSSFVATN